METPIRTPGIPLSKFPCLSSGYVTTRNSVLGTIPEFPPNGPP